MAAQFYVNVSKPGDQERVSIEDRIVFNDAVTAMSFLWEQKGELFVIDRSYQPSEYQVDYDVNTGEINLIGVEKKANSNITNIYSSTLPHITSSVADAICLLAKIDLLLYLARKLKEEQGDDRLMDIFRNNHIDNHTQKLSNLNFVALEKTIYEIKSYLKPSFSAALFFKLQDKNFKRTAYDIVSTKINEIKTKGTVNHIITEMEKSLSHSKRIRS